MNLFFRQVPAVEEKVKEVEQVAEKVEEVATNAIQAVQETLTESAEKVLPK